MKFKSSTEARHFINSKKAELGVIDSKIQARSAEAKDEAITIEARGLIIKEVEGEVAKRNQINVDLADAEKEEVELRSKEQEQFGILGNVGSSTVEARNSYREKQDDVYSSIEYRNAWVQAIKTGDQSEVKRLASTAKTDAGNGGVVIPTEVANKIETLLRKGGTIADLCRKTYQKGYLSVPYEISSSDALDAVEGAAAGAEGSYELGTVDLSPLYIRKWTKLTKELEAMDPGAFIDYVLDDLVEKVRVKLDSKILVGTGTKGVVGIINALRTNGVATLEVSAVDFGTGYAAMSKLDNDIEADAVVVMNRATYFDHIMQLKDSTGQPIYKIINDANGKPQFYYAGMRCKFNSSITAYSAAAAAGTLFMIVGNFNGYQLNLPEGESVQIIRDHLSLSESGQIKYTGDLFAAGNITKDKHFVKVVKAA